MTKRSRARHRRPPARSLKNHADTYTPILHTLLLPRNHPPHSVRRACGALRPVRPDRPQPPPRRYNRRAGKPHNHQTLKTNPINNPIEITLVGVGVFSSAWPAACSVSRGISASLRNAARPGRRLSSASSLARRLSRRSRHDRSASLRYKCLSRRSARLARLIGRRAGRLFSRRAA